MGNLMRVPPGATTVTSLRGKRVAVTGATGFLGGHILAQLESAGASVVAVIDRGRAASRHPGILHSVETAWFDGAESLVATVAAAHPEYVVHLHAIVTTERTANALRSTVRDNLLPSLDLMMACTELPVRRVLLIGSGEEFGPVTAYFDDKTVADPPSPYGASKAAITCYARMFHRAFGLPVAVLRPSVIYGPHQAPRMLVPQVMHALSQGREIPVTEGKQTRDFIYVGDVARAVVRALTAEAIDGKSYNLGSGEVVTVKDCLRRIERVSGRDGLIRFGAIPYKSGEIFSGKPLVEETYRALGWRPTVSLDEGLARTWASFAGSLTETVSLQETGAS